MRFYFFVEYKINVYAVFDENERLEKSITEFRSWDMGCLRIPEVKFNAVKTLNRCVVCVLRCCSNGGKNLIGTIKKRCTIRYIKYVQH